MTTAIVMDNQLRPVVILDAMSAMSWEMKHNDLSTASITLPRDDPCTASCTALAWVNLVDGSRNLGLYRISAIASDDTEGSSNVYTLEHALALLLDDVVYGEMVLDNVTIREAIEALLERQTVKRWMLGACEFDSRVSMSVSGETILGAIQGACGQLGEEYTWRCDTGALPFRLDIQRASTRAACGVHYGRNMVGLTRQVDTSALVTRLYLLGGATKDGQVDVTSLTEGGVPYIDADTIGTWGIKAAIYQDDSLVTPEQLMERGREVLEKNKNPLYTYTVTGLDLYEQTGLQWDMYEPGEQVMVTDDDHGVRFTARIVSVGKQDALFDPGNVVITIANEPKDELGTLTSMQQALQSVQDRGIRAAIANFIVQDEMTGMSTQVTRNAQEIALRATWEAHNKLGQRVSSAESSIGVQAEAVTILSGKTTALEGDMTVTQAQMRVANDNIGVLVTKTESLGERVTTAEAGLEVLAGDLKLYAKQDDMDEVYIRLNAAESSITAQGRQIELKASKDGLDAAVLRLNAAEGSITAQGKLIAAQAEQIDLKASKDGLDAAVLRLNAAEGSITAQGKLIAAQAEQIDLKVSKGDLNSSISLHGDGVTIEGGTIKLVGYVKTSELEAAKARIGTLESTAITASTLKANIASLGDLNISGGLSANSMQAQYGTFSNASIGNVACRKSRLTIGSKSCDFFAPADATFDVADTEEYKAAVSAVSLTKGTPSAVWIGSTTSYSVSIPYTLSNGKSGTLSHIVSAQSAYDTGHTNGESSVTLTKGMPSATYVASTNSYSVSIPYTLSNGKSGTLSHIVSAQDAYDAGYAAGYKAASDGVTVSGGITSITSPTTGLYLASGWAAAYLDGKELAYRTFSKGMPLG